MTAICKTKLIHGANPLKTMASLDDVEKELLVSGILCQPETALLDFALVRERYQEVRGPERTYRYEYFDRRTGETRAVRRAPVTAVHLIQSFSEKGLDPRTVHQVGMELLIRKAISLIRHVGGRYHHTYAPSDHIVTNKLELMEQALETVTRMEIGTHEGLRQRLEMTPSWATWTGPAAKSLVS